MNNEETQDPKTLRKRSLWHPRSIVGALVNGRYAEDIKIQRLFKAGGKWTALLGVVYALINMNVTDHKAEREAREREMTRLLDVFDRHYEEGRKDLGRMIDAVDHLACEQRNSNQTERAAKWPKFFKPEPMKDCDKR